MIPSFPLKGLVSLRVMGVGAALLFTQGCLYHAVKPLPDGLSYRSELLPATDVRFLRDETSLDEAGGRASDQQIFDEAFAMIAKAERLVVVDMFLFNEFLGAGSAPHRRLCEELTGALIARKRAVPALRAVVITDPVNTVYGGLDAPHLARLRAAGVEVVVTRLDHLRDSNPVWSCGWRMLAKPWGNSETGGWLANPFGEGKVTLRSWLTLLNFKANHRKVVIVDTGGELRALVTSANPHDGSSAHSNVGFAFGGLAARAALEAEQAVIDFSGGDETPLTRAVMGPEAGSVAAGGSRVQVLPKKPSPTRRRR